MRKFYKVGMAIVAASAALVGWAQAAQWEAPALSALDVPVAIGAATLSVMTYNVEGLPFPLRTGRGDAARQIGERLRVMRAAGVQPHVVVLQEAFGDAQRAIGAAAGYRYVVFGPGRDQLNHEPMSVEDRAFAAGGRILKGEAVGKWMGSGLAILSDYPIVATAREAFPTYACAGFDCLANKGVLLAQVQVPGAAQPVAVVATHMNSKQASGVSSDRFTYAWLRQNATIGRFLGAILPADMPYVVAGDTNIGKSAGRRAVFQAMLAGLPRATDGGVVRTALATCLDPQQACVLGTPGEVRKASARGKDWQAYGGGKALTMQAVAVDAPFGHDAAGNMLSDHIGYTAFYRLASTIAPAQRSTVVALR